MTREEVIANETAKRMQADGKLIETDSLTLWYKPINLFGSDFTLQYEFDSSKLKMASYHKTLSLLDDPKRLYSDFRQSLITKYGQPFSDNEEWSGIFKDASEEQKDWQTALLTNNLNVSAAWNDSLTIPNRIIILKIENPREDHVLSCMNFEKSFLRKRLLHNQQNNLKNF